MTEAIPGDDWTLREARDWLRERVEDGASCPCCTQFAKVYKRNINAQMTRALINLYHEHFRSEGGWGHLPSMDPSHGEGARLSYWGLIEEEGRVREDGGRAGWWRITEKGIDWLHSRLAVPTYARVYDGRLLGLRGPPYWVKDAVKEKFDLEELMRR